MGSQQCLKEGMLSKKSPNALGGYQNRLVVVYEKLLIYTKPSNKISFLEVIKALQEREREKGEAGTRTKKEDIKGLVRLNTVAEITLGGRGIVSRKGSEEVNVKKSKEAERESRHIQIVMEKEQEIEVEGTGRTFSFVAESAEEAKEWYNIISLQVDKCKREEAARRTDICVQCLMGNRCSKHP